MEPLGRLEQLSDDLEQLFLESVQKNEKISASPEKLARLTGLLQEVQGAGQTAKDQILAQVAASVDQADKATRALAASKGKPPATDEDVVGDPALSWEEKQGLEPDQVRAAVRQLLAPWRARRPAAEEPVDDSREIWEDW